MSDKGSLTAFISPYPRRPWMAQTGACAPAGQTRGLKGISHPGLLNESNFYINMSQFY